MILLRHSVFALLAMTMGTIFSCGSDSDENPSTEDISNSSKVDILFLQKASEQEETVPRMLACVDEWAIAEFANADISDMDIFLVANQETGESYVMLASDSTVLICSCFSDSSIPDRRALIYNSIDGGIHVALCNVDWSSGTYTIEEQTFVNDMTTRAPIDHDLDFAREDVTKLLNNIKGATDRVGWITSILDLPRLNMIPFIWGKVAIPYAKYSLWEDNPERLREIREEYIEDVGEDIILNMIPSTKPKKIWYGFKLMGGLGTVKEYGGRLWDKVGAAISDDDIPDVATDSKVQRRIRCLTDIAHATQPMRHNFFDNSRDAKYTVNVEVLSVAETEAIVAGSYDMQDDYGSVGSVISKMGFVVREAGNASTEREFNVWDLRETTITGLKAGTDYEVWAFIGTMFGRRTSEMKTFTTEGLLKVSPSELVFGLSGGSINVAVTVGKGMTWSIGDKPDWCSANKEGTGFVVKVESSKEIRSDIITVVATTRSGNTVMAEIGIFQRENICPDDNHPHAIDLGLPSSTKWACCNVEGRWYAWGMTETQAWYNQGHYKYYDSEHSQCMNLGIDIAGTQYDAATVNWGAPWHMPSKAQMQELLDYCTPLLDRYGYYSGTFIGPNGNAIFLPFDMEGCDDFGIGGHCGCYWSSTIGNEGGSEYAYCLYFSPYNAYMSTTSRFHGCSIRPVR